MNVLNYSFPSGNVTPTAKVEFEGSLLIMTAELKRLTSFQFLILYYIAVILSLKNATLPVFLIYRVIYISTF